MINNKPINRTVRAKLAKKIFDKIKKTGKNYDKQQNKK